MATEETRKYMIKVGNAFVSSLGIAQVALSNKEYKAKVFAEDEITNGKITYRSHGEKTFDYLNEEKKRIEDNLGSKDVKIVIKTTHITTEYEDWIVN